MLVFKDINCIRNNILKGKIKLISFFISERSIDRLSCIWCTSEALSSMPLRLAFLVIGWKFFASRPLLHFRGIFDTLIPMIYFQNFSKALSKNTFPVSFLSFNKHIFLHSEFRNFQKEKLRQQDSTSTKHINNKWLAFQVILKKVWNTSDILKVQTTLRFVLKDENQFLELLSQPPWWAFPSWFILLRIPSSLFSNF